MALKAKIITRLRRGLSLRAKITILFTLILIPIIFVSAVLTLNREARIIEKRMVERGILVAQTGAAVLGLMFEEAIAQKVLTEEGVFDTEYRPVPDSVPTRYHTAYDHYVDRVCGSLFEGCLSESVLYVAAVDRNGYVPTLHSSFPDSDADDFINGGKRIFNDETVLSAALNEEPYLVQDYRSGTGEAFWDVWAPVYVNDRHWGAVRAGVPVAAAEQAAAGVWKPWMVVGSATVVVFVVMALGAGAVARSVELLRRAMEKAGDGDFSRRVTLDSCAEFRSLSATFNRMLDDLDRRSKNEWMQKAAVEEANLRLREMVVADELTEARSRKYLFERLREEINVGQRTGKKLSVIFFDIDGFKRINDRYGHRAGDRFLVELIASIARQLRPYDVLARYGGDEFVILSPGTSERQARELAERVRRIAAETAVEIDGRPVRASLSMGVASIEWFEDEPAEITAEKLLVKADERAYRAKRQGGNRVV